MTYEARAELKLVLAMPCKKEEDEINDNKRRSTRTAAYVLFRR